MKRINIKRQISVLLMIAMLMSSGVAVLADEETGVTDETAVNAEDPETEVPVDNAGGDFLYEDTNEDADANEDEVEAVQEEEYIDVNEEDEVSVLSSGFDYDYGKTYYLVNGVRQTGWIKDGNYYYYGDSNGVLAENCWEKIDGKWYYFWDVYMQTGVEYIDGNDYYFNSKGAMQTGWIKDGSNYYYANSNGILVQDCWKKIDGKWYYFSGITMLSDGKYDLDGDLYYFNSKGAMQTGWIRVNAYDDYYYAESSGKLVTGWKKINNIWYYFDGNGYMATGKEDIGNSLYYFSDSGAMRTGWIKINAYGDYYYAGSNGRLYQNKWLKENGKWYYFDKYGEMETYSVTIKGKTYYFNDDGSCKNP